jgi:hypothetical protein
MWSKTHHIGTQTVSYALDLDHKANGPYKTKGKKMDTKVFYPNTVGNGKWHAINTITGVALCHNELMDTTVPPIHVSPIDTKFHFWLCKKCLKLGK